MRVDDQIERKLTKMKSIGWWVIVILCSVILLIGVPAINREATPVQMTITGMPFMLIGALAIRQLRKRKVAN
jgi:hypothetical protein